MAQNTVTATFDFFQGKKTCINYLTPYGNVNFVFETDVYELYVREKIF